MYLLAISQAKLGGGWTLEGLIILVIIVIGVGWLVRKIIR